jgi:hypothetical protein
MGGQKGTSSAAHCRLRATTPADDEPELGNRFAGGFWSPVRSSPASRSARAAYREFCGPSLGCMEMSGR